MWGRSKREAETFSLEEGTRTLLNSQSLALSIGGETIKSLVKELDAIKAHDKAQGIELKRVQDELTAQMEFQRVKEASWVSFGMQQASEISSLKRWNGKLENTMMWFFDLHDCYLSVPSMSNMRKSAFLAEIITNISKIRAAWPLS